MWRYWIGIHGPDRFSVHGHPSRTNNKVEIWNRWFNHSRCQNHRNNFWDYIGRNFFQLVVFNFLTFLSLSNLQAVEEATRRDVKALSRNQKVRRDRTKKQKDQDSRIRKLERDLEESKITLREFLSLAAYCFEPSDVSRPNW